MSHSADTVVRQSTDATNVASGFHWNPSSKARQADVALATYDSATLMLVLQQMANLRQELAALREQVASSRGWSTAISTLDDPRYRLSAHLPVDVRESEDGVVVHSPDFEIFGSGETFYEALDDLRRTVIADFELLSGESILGPGPARQLSRMNALVQRLP